MLTQFQEKAQKAIVIAESIAYDLGHSSVGSEHLLLSLLKMKDSTFSKTMKKYQVDDSLIYKDMMRLFGEKDAQPFYMEYSDVVKKILEDAISLSEAKKENKVSLNTLTLALLMQKESVAVELLNKYHIPFDEVKQELNDKTSLLHELNHIHELINYNEIVQKEKRILIGREKEIEQLFLTLCKKEKNNVLLIGKAGVGKTALVEKLAVMINEKQVPVPLQKKMIFELNLSSIVAGTRYRGEFEEKFRRIIDKIIQAKDAIIFIDEIHNLIGAGGAEGAIDASNILKPYLARRDLTIIGATTIEEYYKYFEKDQAMNRRFSIIKLKENTKEETITILEGVKQQYEEFHHVSISRQNIEDIIELCDQYLIQRVFPDKALDVLDLSCVKAHFLKSKTIEKEHILFVLEELTGMNMNPVKVYQSLFEKLQQKIYGQEQALKILTLSLQSLLTYPHPHKPQGIYMLAGPSGVGKTETVKELSRILDRHLIRMNMSEYSDASSVSKIIGTAPGYIGYDDRVSILHEMTLHPHSILLLDEIEKAHPQVLHLFLQVFDEGILQDNHQRSILFKDTLIFMTSNKGTNYNEVGFKKSDFSKEAFEECFSPEFLNRIDEIIPYQSLDMLSLEKILHAQSPYPLSPQMIEDILKDYDPHLGARTLFRQMKKYLIQQR